MFFGEDYKIKDGIIISQPTIGDILSFGEKQFYQMLNPFIANPTSFRVSLWQNNVDWTTITDYELFCQLILQLQPKPEQTFLLFKDLDFSKFELCKRHIETSEGLVEDVVLFNKGKDILIDEDTYTHIAHYLRTMFNIFPKVEKARGKATKEAIIFEDEQNLIDAEKAGKETGFESFLLPLISSCLIHPGFKYKKNELKEVGIYEFM